MNGAAIVRFTELTKKHLMRQLSMRILFFSWYDNIVVVKQKGTLPMLVERELLIINLERKASFE